MLTTKFSISNKQAAFGLIMLVFAFVTLTLTQDYLRATLKNSAFYFSESFMFSSFWWLFAPLLYAQYFVARYKNNKQLKFQLAIIGLPVLLHLFAFPFLLWMVSSAFYYHTYSIQQTLSYTLSEHAYLLVLFYSIPVLICQFFSEKIKLVAPVFEIRDDLIEQQFITTILISEGNKKHHVNVADILYCSANPPYIYLHLDCKKYLHSETLKSISGKLNPGQFVRVHKSTIVNIKMVASYTTRLNGDYDLILKNNVQLRVSRSFAIDFKDLFNKTHRFTTE